MIDKDFELPKIDMPLPKDIPADFFDRLPERTLELAKIRGNRQRRRRQLLRTLTMFSTAAVVLLLVTVVLPKDHRKELRAETLEDVLQDLPDDDLATMNVVYDSELMEQALLNENTN
jgi:hypothetical protein